MSLILCQHRHLRSFAREREISLALQCHKMVPSIATHMYIPQVMKSTWLHVKEKKGGENLRVASGTQIQEFSAVLS